MSYNWEINMKQTYILNEDIKKSNFTVLMLEALGFKLVDSTEVVYDGEESESEGTQKHSKYVRLAFQRDTAQKSVLFW